MAITIVSIALAIIVVLAATQLFSTATQAVILTAAMMFLLGIHATNGKGK